MVYILLIILLVLSLIIDYKIYKLNKNIEITNNNMYHIAEHLSAKLEKNENQNR